MDADVPSGTEERSVEQVWSIGRTNHEHIVAGFARGHSIEFSQQLTYNSVHHAPGIAVIPSLWGDRVQFIKKDDTRLRISGLLENAANISL
jgi:hypothetical protein